jgi:tetratricopeptide (TPR) repeat protein
VRIVFSILFFLFIISVKSQSTFSRAKNYFLQNDIEAAMASLDSCAQQKEFADSALYLKSYLCVKNNRLAEAEALSNQLHKRNKNFHEVWYVKGLLSSVKGKHAMAAEQFTRVLNHYPDHIKALYNRALSKAMLEDLRGAIEDLDHCIKLDINYSNAYYSRAYWYEVLKEYDKAVSDYEKTIALDKNHKEAYLGLAYTLNEKGEKQKACDILHQATENGVSVAHDLQENFCK